MKHWHEDTSGKNGNELRLVTDNHRCDIIELKKLDDGTVRLTELCDEYFSLVKTKEETIELLQEAINWLGVDE
jgi:hypothetical protein